MRNTRLIELREGAKMTQQQLAETVGLTQSMVALIESGRRSPSWTYRLRLAHWFGVSVEWLFFALGDDKLSLESSSCIEGRDND